MVLQIPATASAMAAVRVLADAPKFAITKSAAIVDAPAPVSNDVLLAGALSAG